LARPGPQGVTVRAYSGSGRGGAPCLVVGVGTGLTYAYDSASVASRARLQGRWVPEPHRAPAGVHPNQRDPPPRGGGPVGAVQRDPPSSAATSWAVPARTAARSSASRSAPSPWTCTPPAPCAPTSPHGARQRPSRGCSRTHATSS